MKIFLVGMPGSGKSTIGKPLASKLNIPFFDLDDVIEKAEGLAVKQVFAQKGEVYFRNSERNCLYNTTTAFADFVLSTGGGTPCFFDNMEFMKRDGKVVFLNIEIFDLTMRVQKEGLEKRPLLKEYTTIESLQEYLLYTFSERKPYYEKADIEISSSDKTPDDIVRTIISELKIKS